MRILVVGSGGREHALVWKTVQPKLMGKFFCILMFLTLFVNNAYCKTAQEYFKRGLVNAENGKYDQAVLDFSKAIEMSPNYAQAYYERGNIYKEIIGNRNQAIADWSKAIQINPNYAEAYLQRGKAIYDDRYSFSNSSKDYDSIIFDLTKAIQINLNYEEAYLYRARAYFFGKHNLDQAIADLNKVIEINPTNSEAYNLRSHIYFRKGNEEQSYSDLKQYGKFKDNDKFYRERKINEEKKNIDSMIYFFDKAIEFNPKDADLYLLRGSYYAQKGNINQALSDFNRSLELNPRNCLFYQTRGDFYLKHQQYDSAWQDIHRAEELGCKPSQELIDELRRASGREK